MASILSSQPAMTYVAIWDWSGYIGLLLLIFLLIRREQYWMKEYLADEYSQMLLSSEQYRIACSAWCQSSLFIKSLMSGKYQATRYFYQTCGDLMHKKRQYNRHGDQNDTVSEINRLRLKISQLAKEI